MKEMTEGTGTPSPETNFGLRPWLRLCCIVLYCIRLLYKLTERKTTGQILIQFYVLMSLWWRVFETQRRKSRIGAYFFGRERTEGRRKEGMGKGKKGNGRKGHRDGR